MSLFQNLDMTDQLSLTLLVIVLLVLAVLIPVVLKQAPTMDESD